MKKNSYEQNIESKCAACGKNILLDQFGHGRCSNCGWYNNGLGLDNEEKVIFPNYISLSKARQLAKEGKPFKISIDDLISGIFFYGEMIFDYNGNNYEVCGNEDDSIELLGNEGKQVFANAKEFIETAKVGSQLLKDVWDKVKNISYL